MSAKILKLGKKMEGARQFNEEVEISTDYYIGFGLFQHFTLLGGQPLQVSHYKAGIGEGGLKEGVVEANAEGKLSHGLSNIS